MRVQRIFASVKAFKNVMYVLFINTVPVIRYRDAEHQRRLIPSDLYHAAGFCMVQSVFDNIPDSLTRPLLITADYILLIA